MIGALARAAAVSIALAVHPLATTTTIKAPDAPPTASLGGTYQAIPNSTIAVTGLNWPGNTNVTAEVCGNRGASSVDCFLPGSRTVGVAADGLLTITVGVAVPPSPCPCVVRVTDLATAYRVDLPIEVLGAPVSMTVDPQTGATFDRVNVQNVTVRSFDSYREWLGLAPKRAVRFTVTNSGAETLRDVPVALLVGRGSDPGRQVDAPNIDKLDPGTSKTVEIPVSLDTLAFGSFRIRGNVGRSNWTYRFDAQSSAYPWILIALLFVGVQIGVLWLRNQLRRRLAPVPIRTPGWAGELPFGVIDSPPTTVIDLTERAAPWPAPTDAPLELEPWEAEIPVAADEPVEEPIDLPVEAALEEAVIDLRPDPVVEQLRIVAGQVIDHLAADPPNAPTGTEWVVATAVRHDDFWHASVRLLAAGADGPWLVPLSDPVDLPLLSDESLAAAVLAAVYPDDAEVVDPTDDTAGAWRRPLARQAARAARQIELGAVAMPADLDVSVLVALRVADGDLVHTAVAPFRSEGTELARGAVRSVHQMAATEA